MGIGCVETFTPNQRDLITVITDADKRWGIQSSCFNFKTRSCFNFKTISATDLTKFYFLGPNYGYCYSLRESRQVFLEHSACVKDHKWCCLPKHEFWTVVLVMLSVRAGWPKYIANYSHMRSVPRCLCAWKCSDRIIHVFKTSCFHSILQYPPDIVTIRVPLVLFIFGYVVVTFPLLLQFAPCV